MQELTAMLRRVEAAALLLADTAAPR